MRHLPLLTALCCVLAVSPLWAKSKQKGPQRPAPVDAAGNPIPDEKERSTEGEIVARTGSGFEIRPWNAELPARMQVSPAANARYLEQKRGKAADVQVGDFVTVVPEEGPVHYKPPFYSVLKDKNPPESTKPKWARGVVRYWSAGGADGEVEPEDRKTASLLLKAASPFFKGEIRGGIDKPVKNEVLATGVVTAVKPLTVKTKQGEKQFVTDHDTLWVTHQTVKPDALEKGKSVMLETSGPVTGDKPLEAVTVAVTPKPRLGDKHMGKILVREKKYEQGKK